MFFKFIFMKRIWRPKIQELDYENIVEDKILKSKLCNPYKINFTDNWYTQKMG